MKFLLELKDDLVLISTWQGSSESWYCWGAFHIDAFYQPPPGGIWAPVWYQELKTEGKVIVKAEFSLDTSLQLPPDNLS